jgi:two-component system response regulator RegA
VIVQDLRAIHAEIEIVVLTGYASIATAVEAIRIGARNYLPKPANADQILTAFDPEPVVVSGELDYEIPSLARLEHEHIERVLRECNGNVSKTARILGMHRRTLQYKLAKFPVKR